MFRTVGVLALFQFIANSYNVFLLQLYGAAILSLAVAVILSLLERTSHVTLINIFFKLSGPPFNVYGTFEHCKIYVISVRHDHPAVYMHIVHQCVGVFFFLLNVSVY